MIPFLALENIKVTYSGKDVLNDISLQINEGEHWAITGESGSGKTTLLDTIAGKHYVRSGGICYHRKKRIAQVSHQHHFKNRYNLNEFYYQQRFNSADAEEAVKVSDYLSENSFSEYHQDQDAGQLPGGLIRELHLEELLNKSLIKLSNGETRRLMFARALIQEPQLLLLDAPFTGLDASTRPYFHELINRLASEGLMIIMATAETEIPKGITHLARLEGGRLSGTWERKDFFVSPKSDPEADSLAPDESILRNLLFPASQAPFNHAVIMKNICVKYGDTPILQDVNWSVRKGERWALSGHNGAGKSTLLSLINADNPQAYANDIVLFDRKRGSGESIWDIKKKIGYVSPELHQYFKTADTCLQVVLSGLFDTLGLIHKCSPVQQKQAASWLALLDIAGYAGSLFRNVPLSIQRLVLIARALIKKPPLLVLDEPCQGMDEKQVQRIRLLIDAVCRIAGTTLIYVSHYQEEIPSCVDRVLKLYHGKVKY